MAKRGGWKSKLTKKELRHLRIDANVTTLGAAERTFKGQAEMRQLNDNPICEPCWECKGIAVKLGFPV